MKPQRWELVVLGTVVLSALVLITEASARITHFDLLHWWLWR